MEFAAKIVKLNKKIVKVDIKSLFFINISPFKQNKTTQGYLQGQLDKL